MPSEWETTLYCNIVSHWLGAFTKSSLDEFKESCASHQEAISMETIIKVVTAARIWTFKNQSWIETTLYCNIVSHWLGAFTKSSLDGFKESCTSHQEAISLETIIKVITAARFWTFKNQSCIYHSMPSCTLAQPWHSIIFCTFVDKSQLFFFEMTAKLFRHFEMVK